MGTDKVTKVTRVYMPATLTHTGCMVSVVCWALFARE